MGSRVSTASRKVWCPRVLYGLPCGRRALSACALHCGHMPRPSWRFGQPGLEQTRIVIAAPPRMSEALTVQARASGFRVCFAPGCVPTLSRCYGLCTHGEVVCVV